MKIKTYFSPIHDFLLIFYKQKKLESQLTEDLIRKKTIYNKMIFGVFDTIYNRAKLILVFVLIDINESTSSI